MSLPPFVYVLKFWEAFTFLVGGVLALLAFFGVIPAQYAIGSAALLQAILAVLGWFGINPEIRSWFWSTKAKKLLGK